MSRDTDKSISSILNDAEYLRDIISEFEEKISDLEDRLRQKEEELYELQSKLDEQN